MTQKPFFLSDERYFLITESELTKVCEVLRDEGCGRYSEILFQTIHFRPADEQEKMLEVRTLKYYKNSRVNHDRAPI